MPISLLLSTKFVKKLFQPMSFRFGIQYFAQIKGDHQSMATKKVYLCSKSKSMLYMSNYIAVCVCITVPTLFFDKANLEKNHNSVSVQPQLYLQDHIPEIFHLASRMGVSNWKACQFLLRQPPQCTCNNHCQCTRHSSSSAFQGWMG